MQERDLEDLVRASGKRNPGRGAVSRMQLLGPLERHRLLMIRPQVLGAPVTRVKVHVYTNDDPWIQLL